MPTRLGTFTTAQGWVDTSDRDIAGISRALGDIFEAASPGSGGAGQADLLRCIFGNPSRPVVWDRRWRTDDTVGLARGIYEDRAFDRLPLLADALMDAGCDHEQVLDHWCSPGPHARGCWVVDLVLGKE
jgi:hypothetical protein